METFFLNKVFPGFLDKVVTIPFSPKPSGAFPKFQLLSTKFGENQTESRLAEPGA